MVCTADVMVLAARAIEGGVATVTPSTEFGARSGRRTSWRSASHATRLPSAPCPGRCPLRRTEDRVPITSAALDTGDQTAPSWANRPHLRNFVWIGRSLVRVCRSTTRLTQTTPSAGPAVTGDEDPSRFEATTGSVGDAPALTRVEACKRVPRRAEGARRRRTRPDRQCGSLSSVPGRFSAVSDEAATELDVNGLRSPRCMSTICEGCGRTGTRPT